MLSISCVEKEEDTIWTELLVVTASHYEAVRCARLKKAAMIIMIQSVRSGGEWVSPKKTAMRPLLEFVHHQHLLNSSSWLR